MLGQIHFRAYYSFLLLLLLLSVLSALLIWNSSFREQQVFWVFSQNL
jgi:hypothetical protein